VNINSFPQVEGHYCRSNSTVSYLSPELSISQMYRLYKSDFCATKNISDPVTSGVYRRIFVTDFNLRFFVPKKDQCSTCNAYYDATGDEKTALKSQWEEHKRREKESMEMKEADKSTAKADKSVAAITFDLQAVLPIPFAGDAQIYYMRKLAAYNFTIYETGTQKGFCYIWDETEGHRGANEIATCLLHYIRLLPSCVKQVCTFSDTCAGQNRNQHLCAAMLYAISSTSVSLIDVKYMESGHSYLEADSMHSTIERARRHQKILQYTRVGNTDICCQEESRTLLCDTPDT